MTAPSTNPSPDTHNRPASGPIPQRQSCARRATAIGLIALTVLAAGPRAHAGIFVAGGELGLQAALQQDYDTNIFANNLEQGDWISVITPEAIFVRDAGLIRVEGHAGVRGYYFYDFTEQNSWDPFFQGTLVWKRDQNKADALLDGSVRRRSEANPDVNTRTVADEGIVRGHFAYNPTEKLGYRFTGHFMESDIRDRTFADLRTAEVGGEGRYQYSPKYQTLVGLGFRRSTSFNVPSTIQAMDSSDVKLRAGVTGEVLPKVTGQVVAGYVWREYRTVSRPRQAGVLFDTSLVYRPDDDTSVTLVVARDFDTTPLDESVLQLITSLEGRRQLAQKWAIIAGVSHRKSRYIGAGAARTDESYLVRAGLDYQLTPKFRAEVRGSYSTTDSTRRISDYDRSIFSAAMIALF